MDGLSEYLINNGPFAVACIVLGSVVWYQQKKLDKKDARIDELQDLRLQYTKDIIKEQTAVLQGNSEANRILAEKIEIAKQWSIR